MNNLRLLFAEERGTLRKYWLVCEETNTNYLFKECTEEEIEAEVYVSWLGQKLGMNVVENYPYTLTNIKGILSKSYKRNGYTYKGAESIYNRSKQFTLTSHKSNISKLPKGNVTFKEFIDTYPFLKQQMIEMMILDCLVCNLDRHSSNWELELDEELNIVGLAKIFDFNRTLKEVHPFEDRNLLKWDLTSEMELTHYEFFSKLYQDYKEETLTVMKRLDEHKENFICFVSKRYEEMLRVMNKEGE